MNSPRSRLNTIILHSVFSMMIFLAFFSILELVLRTTHLFGARLSWTMPDSIVGYKFSPGRTYWSRKENDHPISGKINQFGWRDRERSIGKPDGTYRIAVLGDSFVEARQVEEDLTFLSLLEHQLSDALGRQVEVLNFGRSGFTQTEEYVVLKNDIAQFSVDLVLLFFFPGNDIADISRLTARDRSRPFYSVSPRGELILDASFADTLEFRIRSLLNFPKQHSALISFIINRYVQYKLGRARQHFSLPSKGEIEPPNSRLQDYLSLYSSRPDEIYAKNYLLNKILIKQMAQFCAEHGMRFALVNVDIPTYIPQVMAQYQEVDSTFAYDHFDEDLRIFASSIGIEFWD